MWRATKPPLELAGSITVSPGARISIPPILLVAVSSTAVLSVVVGPSRPG